MVFVMPDVDYRSHWIETNFTKSQLDVVLAVDAGTFSVQPFSDRVTHPFPVDRELQHHITLVQAFGGVERLPTYPAKRQE